MKDHALFTVGLTGQLTSWNRGADGLLGFDESGAVGQNISCIFNPEDIRNGLPERQLRKALQTGWAS